MLMGVVWLVGNTMFYLRRRVESHSVQLTINN